MNSNIPEKFHDDEFPLSVVDVCNEIIQNGPGEDLDAPNRILIAEKGCPSVWQHMGASCYAGSMSYIDVSGSIEQEHMFPAEISRRVLSLGRDKHDGSSITTQFEIERCETLGALYDKVVSRKAGEKGD